jgi:CRP-like cAMP-binding protein
VSRLRDFMKGYPQMAATLIPIQTRPEKLRRDKAERLLFRLKELESEMDLPVDLMCVLHREIDKHTASQGKWTFIMISPEQNEIVTNYLAENSDRPLVAIRLWLHCFRYLRCDTGEILLRRDEIADHLKIDAKNVSSIMSELEECGAISRKYQRIDGTKGRGFVRYFMNPLVGTHLAGAARDKAQEKAPKLRLVKACLQACDQKGAAATTAPT